jgi:hypothetical protein
VVRLRRRVERGLGRFHDGCECLSRGGSTLMIEELAPYRRMGAAA